jgi:omega-6 fatty acid desaturase (delta-12 desaturase)
MSIESQDITGAPDREEKKRLRAILTRYQRPSTGRALWQIFNTIAPYVLLWFLMYHVKEISLWLAIPLAMLAGTLLVRVFIFFHDCGHGSFFKSPWANAIAGFIAGVLTFTPYYHWRWQHGIHHGTSGHLDKRGVGDVWTMTVQEYLDSSRWRRFSYRFVRNPFVLFVIAPLYVFLFRQRFASSTASPRERYSVWWMNLALLVVAVLMSWLFGFGEYLLLQTVAWMVAGATGIWLFYIQHQFEDAYWERDERWDYTAAALQGSSYYKLPRVLQWFSGNIGFHHIHHLSPRIPNYNLQRCHEADPVFQQVQPITLLESLKSLKFRFWDEPAKKLVGYARMRQVKKEQQHQSAQLSTKPPARTDDGPSHGDRSNVD